MRRVPSSIVINVPAVKLFTEHDGVADALRAERAGIVAMARGAPHH